MLSHPAGSTDKQVPLGVAFLGSAYFYLFHRLFVEVSGNETGIRDLGSGFGKRVRNLRKTYVVAVGEGSSADCQVGSQAVAAVDSQVFVPGAVQQDIGCTGKVRTRALGGPVPDDGKPTPKRWTRLYLVVVEVEPLERTALNLAE